MIERIASLLALLLVAACGSNATGHGGGVPGGCVPVTITPLALDEPTPAGITAADLLVADGQHQGTLTWRKGGTTPVTATVAVDATTASWVDRDWPPDASGGRPDVLCGDSVEMDATFIFDTEDGAFAEAWSSKVVAYVPMLGVSEVSVSQSVHPSEVAGTYQVTEVDPSQYDELTLSFYLRFTEAGTAGEVGLTAVQRPDTNDPNGTVSATFFEVGSF